MKRLHLMGSTHAAFYSYQMRTGICHFFDEDPRHRVIYEALPQRSCGGDRASASNVTKETDKCMALAEVGTHANETIPASERSGNKRRFPRSSFRRPRLAASAGGTKSPSAVL